MNWKFGPGSQSLKYHTDRKEYFDPCLLTMHSMKQREEMAEILAEAVGGFLVNLSVEIQWRKAPAAGGFVSALPYAYVIGENCRPVPVPLKVEFPKRSPEAQEARDYLENARKWHDFFAGSSKCLACTSVEMCKWHLRAFSKLKDEESPSAEDLINCQDFNGTINDAKSIAAEIRRQKLSQPATKQPPNHTDSGLVPAEWWTKQMASRAHRHPLDVICAKADAIRALGQHLWEKAYASYNRYERGPRHDRTVQLMDLACTLAKIADEADSRPMPQPPPNQRVKKSV
jgi:hypothetical protein